MPGAALSLEEREEIRAGIELDESLSDIARRLGRVPSTMGREVARNGGRDGYRAVAAEQRAVTERRRPKIPKLTG
ncbi:MAG: helix-turn-helix domain-containing protein, partial [Acidimicrobiia bacterium]